LQSTPAIAHGIVRAPGKLRRDDPPAAAELLDSIPDQRILLGRPLLAW
jgi:hypothetical protein